MPPADGCGGVEGHAARQRHLARRDGGAARITALTLGCGQRLRCVFLDYLPAFAANPTAAGPDAVPSPTRPEIFP